MLLLATASSWPAAVAPAAAQAPAGDAPAPTASPTAPAGIAPEVADDPEVQGAQSQLERARARMAATAAELDALAASFENARGHAERLADELEDADDRVADAAAALDRARAAQAAEIRAAYMAPGADLARRSGALLLAPDVGTALHASALMAHVALTRSREAERARRATRAVGSDVATQRGIASGTQAAMRDLEGLSTTFNLALEAAAAEVAAAEEGLASAVQAAEERAAAQAALGYTAGVQIGDVPAPVVRIATINGGTQEMTCPLGQPNGFIDSWGFPRSGGRTHKGVDMFAAYGMPVVAAADGYVRRVFNNRLGGLSIDLVDGLGNRYYYAHLSAAYVVTGQQVRVGQLLAANGNSGNAIATPPHLHWQFHPGDGGPVNPYPLAAALCR